jgi:hypothetical protein
MIDQIYQSEITKNLDDQQRLPGPRATPQLGTFANFSAGLGGLIGGPLEAAAAKADLIFGDAQILTGAGTDSAGGMFALPSPKEQAEQQAARAKLALSGPNFNSPTGTALRTKAKEFMPDPQTTGKAGVILGGLTNFASQAVPAGLTGPVGLVNLAADRGMQKADELQQQGVDLPTRAAAGVVSGTLDAASLLLPMTGATRIGAAAKGAAGGVGATVAQTAAEKMILEAGGYKQLASTYDPFDPVSMALGAIVPAGFGAAFHGAHAKPGAEPTRADVTLTPAEQAHSDAVESSAWNLKELQQAVEAEKKPANKAILQTELDKLTASHDTLASTPPRAIDPNVEPAARVQQTADAIDNSRLTADDDLVGREQHTQAVETAADQIGRGEAVEVGDLLSRHEIPPELDARIAEVARAADEIRAARAADENAPIKPNRAAFEEARAEAAAKPAGESAPERQASAAQAAPEGAAPHPGPEATHLDAATEEIFRTKPDLMVHLDGMEAPMRASELLQSMRESAALEGKSASLIQVAAQCALSL